MSIDEYDERRPRIPRVLVYIYNWLDFIRISIKKELNISKFTWDNLLILFYNIYENQKYRGELRKLALLNLPLNGGLKKRFVNIYKESFLHADLSRAGLAKDSHKSSWDEFFNIFVKFYIDQKEVFFSTAKSLLIKKSYD